MAVVPEAVRALIEARALSIPQQIARALTETDVPGAPRKSSFVVTGVGCSEGPARYLALLLHLTGARAMFAPLSTFASGSAPACGDTLVVFSQGLSPNARLALGRAAEYRAAFLFTSVTKNGATPDCRACLDAFSKNGGRVVVLPPEEESGTLVRLVGPAVAYLAAARFAGAGAEVSRAVELAGTAPGRAAQAAAALPQLALHRRLAFVTAGPWLEGARGLSGKWVEGLGAYEPALWDVLQVAHGPFLQFFDEEVTLVTLEHEGQADERALFDRLVAMVRTPRHAVLRLFAKLPPPWGAIDHELLTTALLVRALQEGSKDLSAGLGADSILYEVH